MCIGFKILNIRVPEEKYAKVTRNIGDMLFEDFGLSNQMRIEKGLKENIKLTFCKNNVYLNFLHL